MKKEKSCVVKFYMGFVLILSALAVAVFIYAPGIVKVPVVVVPPETQSDIVVEELGNGSKLVKNVVEDFSVVLPEGFEVNERKTDIVTIYGGEGESACVIEIYKIRNEKRLSLEDWMKEGDEYLNKTFTVTKNETEKINYNGKEYYKQIFDAGETVESIAFFYEIEGTIFEVISYVDDFSYVCDNSIESIAKSLEQL